MSAAKNSKTCSFAQNLQWYILWPDTFVSAVGYPPSAGRIMIKQSSKNPSQSWYFRPWNPWRRGDLGMEVKLPTLTIGRITLSYSIHDFQLWPRVWSLGTGVFWPITISSQIPFSSEDRKLRLATGGTTPPVSWLSRPRFMLITLW